MPEQRTRREVMLAMGAAGALSVAPTASASTAQDGCEELAALDAEVEALRDRLDGRQADLERLPTLIVDRQRQILKQHAASAQPRFPADVRAEARAVGLEARESVVVLDVAGRHSQGTATAWFVADHYLLTNAHNVEGEIETLYGVTLDGETFEADLVGRVESQRPDVALLRTEFTGLSLATGDSRSLARDDPLVQVGHPGAEAFGFWALTMGGFDVRRSSDELAASIPGLTGSSGSPILDLDGEVVAMTYGAAGEETASVGPTDDVVRVGLLAAEPSTSAVPIETAIERLEGWT